MRTNREGRRAGSPSRIALALAASLALTVGAAGCDDSSAIEGVLAPSALSGSGSAGAAGGLSVAGRTQAPLVGSWTRLASAGGVLTERTWTFASDGSGTRTTIARSPLGAPLTVEQQPFAWDAGGGILLLRFRGTGGPETTLRASYTVLVGLTGTVLRLDGVDYARTAG